MTETPSARRHVLALNKPSRAGYAAAAVLLVVGFSVFAGTVLPARRAVRDAVFELQRVVVPGDATFRAVAPGPVTLYYEKRSEVAADHHANDHADAPKTRFETPMRWDAPALRAVAADVEGTEPGTAVELRPWAGTGSESSSLVYHVPPYVGESLGTLDLPGPGTYRLALAQPWPPEVDETAAPAATHEHRRVVAVGHVPFDLVKSGLFGIYGAAVVMGLTAVLALVLAALTWARRRQWATQVAS